MTENKRSRQFYLFTNANQHGGRIHVDNLRLETPFKIGFEEIHVIEFSEVERLQGELEAERMLREIAESNESHAAAKLNELESENSELKTKIENYELELATPDCRIAELESKIEDINKNCISLFLHEHRVQSLESTIGRRVEAIAKLESRLRKLVEADGQLSDEMIMADTDDEFEQAVDQYMGRIHGQIISDTQGGTDESC